MEAAAAAFLVVVAANGAVVTESEVRAASAAFLSFDGAGRAILKGRTVSIVSKRGGLWIARLSPSGHIILSGSDLMNPIVGFAETDFVEPDKESPAYSVFAKSEEAIAALEAQGGTRHSRWTKLLEGGGKVRLRAADAPSGSTIAVEPFLLDHYSQWQPYNDYAPVHDPAAGTEHYRGRCQCGCVATAAAQVFHHFKWPARIDDAISFNHVFTDTNNVDSSYPIRFDGHEPIDWNSLSHEYSSWWGGQYDLRGHIAESTRYPIARLIMWCGVMAHMHYTSEGSSSNYGNIMGHVDDWYTPGVWVDVSQPTDYSSIIADLQAGIPLQVELDGHQVVAHGWANDGMESYVFLNFGWGGQNDGYYNMDGSAIEYALHRICVGHYPRAKPQIDPLQTVCDATPTLSWHFPDFYTNNLSGFIVTMQKTSATTSTFTDDFSASRGVASSAGSIYVGTDWPYTEDGYELYDFTNQGNLLYASPSLESGTYTLSDVYTLTSASVLTFKILSFAAMGEQCVIQARFDGGDWEQIHKPMLEYDFKSSGWGVERVYLGGHGGKTCQLRIQYSFSDDSPWYYEEGRILIDDITLTEVLSSESAVARTVAATERTCSFSGLEAGSGYKFSVKPIVSGALVEGEESDSVSTRIAGVSRTPIAGEESFSQNDLVFSPSDTSGTWSYSGASISGASVLDGYGCSVVARLSGPLTEDSVVAFGWKCNNYYLGGVVDVLTVSYIDELGVETVLESRTNASSMNFMNYLSISLGAYAGRRGTIKIDLTHDGGYYWNSMTIQQPSISNVLVPTVPATAWQTETLTARGKPEILSVSTLSEGFYGECGTNTTVLTVSCSDTVVSLEARPSHLSLVRDEDVTVTPIGAGNGLFRVSLTPSGINGTNCRSRMILTLVGTDSNGTKCYKDVSLRFEPVENSVATVILIL